MGCYFVSKQIVYCYTLSYLAEETENVIPKASQFSQSFNVVADGFANTRKFLVLKMPNSTQSQQCRSFFFLNHFSYSVLRFPRQNMYKMKNVRWATAKFFLLSFPWCKVILEWIIDSILEDSKKRDLKSRDNYDESEKNEGKNGEIKREEVGGVCGNLPVKNSSFCSFDNVLARNCVARLAFSSMFLIITFYSYKTLIY